MSTQRRLSLAFVTLFGFLLNALLPFYTLHAAPEPSLNEILGEPIVICTEDGFRTLSADDLDDHRPPVGGGDIRCGMCYLAAHGLTHAVGGTVPAIILPMAVPAVFAAPAQYALRIAAPVHRLSARAPPTLS